MATYHNYATVVFADPRLANVDNYVFKNDSYGSELIPTVLPEGGGGYGATGYEGGVVVCKGRRGRMRVLMPGQTLHLTSAIEYVNEKQVLVWYVDNTSDFEPISKVLRFYLDVVHEGASYEHWFKANGGSAFPMEVFGSSGSDYEDAIFATSILNEENLTDTSLHAEWDIL